MTDMTDDELYHYGILRRSGRYPWGSGGNVETRARTFLSTIKEFEDAGYTPVQIAAMFSTKEHPFNTTDLRNARTLARAEVKAADIAMAQRLKEKGLSNVAIGERMNLNESSVRALLAPGTAQKNAMLKQTADALKMQVDDKGIVDIGLGAENHLGVSNAKLKAAVGMLEDQGYKVDYVKVRQLGTGKETSIKVLHHESMPYSEVYARRAEIALPTGTYSNDGGLTFFNTKPPLNVSSDRVAVKWAEEGGADADGVILVRPGVDDLSLGGARYAQVRIAVDGTHYLKGMARYDSNLPDGVDLVFNTNKSRTADKKDAFKKMSDDPENPFGAVVRQIQDEKGNVKSAMNIVNEEGNWDKWSRNLSSQMLSKQQPELAKQQLAITYNSKREEYDEIMSLTNPTVKRKLLESFADDADAAAVHLKAAGLPRQRTQVILPFNSLKDNEIYAPNFKDGESVVLIRYPHGGKFEIPELRVNNNNREAKSSIGNALDAVGINARVAERLSGADFDGDTVVVIPNNDRRIKTSPQLAKLKNFDPKTAYPGYPGMKVMSDKQKQMGDVSNLITDMTIRGASQDDIARAVRHSMVVIDAEKHKLNYKQSYIDNGIADLKRKYQGDAKAGASTLISRARRTVRVPEIAPRKMSEGGPVDPKTGKKVYVETGATYTDRNGKVVRKTTKLKELATVDDAYQLSSGTRMEAIYAEHSNSLKSLANSARREALKTPRLQYSPTARKTYAPEVNTLRAKLNVALQNAPLERQAQLLANSIFKAKQDANPDLSKDALKKLQGQALTEARERVGAKKVRVEISPREWEAIQAGAVSENMLSNILQHANMDQVKALATPRNTTQVSGARLVRARALLAAGHTQAEVAESLGVPISTLMYSVNGEVG